MRPEANPQYAELRDALSFRMKHPPDAYLTITEPETSVQVELMFRRPAELAAATAEGPGDEELMEQFEQRMAAVSEMSDEALEAEMARLDAEDDAEAAGEDDAWVPALEIALVDEPQAESRAAALGYVAVDVNEFENGSGEQVRQVSLRRAVTDADEAAAVCLRTLHEVLDVPRGAWLWITDIPYDHWPDPLPKPPDWPGDAGR